MQLYKTLCLSFCFLMPLAHAACPVTADDGDTCPGTKAQKFLVFDAEQRQWVDPDVFLSLRKQRMGAPTWGEARVFPPYEKIKELDTFTALTPRGPCDMVFFHNRWRRQADVWVWGEEMKTWRGCAVVFD